MAIKTASVLAFERKLSNSDALMFAGQWADRSNIQCWQKPEISRKDVRGTISNRLPIKDPANSDPAKLNAKLESPNLQPVEFAALPFDADTLKVSFTLRVLGNLAQPSACNDQEYQAELVKKINGYIAEQQFTELAARYAENLANGRFLWRNRVGAEAVEVHVSHIVNGQKTTWIFNSLDFSLRQFSTPTGDLAALAEVIRQGLIGEAFAFLQVDGFVRLGAGQEIFPSQELVLDSKGDSRQKKFLYKLQGQAAMHSQKIGNALRTIDTWYPEAADLGPIAVEPYGSVTNRGKAYRQPKEKMDFYNLLDGWILKDKVPNTEQQHYVIATLIRGGVFGEAA